MDLAEPRGLGGVNGVDVLIEEDLGVTLNGGDCNDVTQARFGLVGAVVGARTRGACVLHVVLDN